MSERWLPVPGYIGRYEVSDLGRVRSLLPWRGKPGPRILREALNLGGRPTVKLCTTGSRKTTEVHVVVAKAFLGARPDGTEIRHLNGRRTDNRLSNLAYGTRSENMQDAVAHGTHANASKTHCRQGHPYDEVNTASRLRGGRQCRICVKAAAERFRRRKAAA